MALSIADQSSATNGTIAPTTIAGQIPGVGYPARLFVSVSSNDVTFLTGTSGSGALEVAVGSKAVFINDFEADTPVNVRSDSGTASVKYSWLRLAR
jgi:hypothetical protein